jgi:O-antigen/teichoic acid export membrane protein
LDGFNPQPLKEKITGLIPFKKIKSQLANLSLYLLASLIASGVNVIINPFLALNLSPEDYGIIGYYLGLNTLFLPLISFSLTAYYSRKFFMVGEEMIDKIRNTLLSLQIAGGLISMLIILLFFNLYAHVVTLSLAVFPFLYLSVLSIYFTNFYSFLLTDKRLSSKPKSFLKFTLANVLIGVIMALLLVVFLKYGASGRLYGILVTAVMIGLISLRNMKFKFTLNKEILKEAAKFSWPMFLSAILYFVFGGYDRVLLERLGDVDTLGIYNVAFQITAYLGIFGTALMQTFDPDIYKATAENNINKALKIMAFIFLLVLMISVIFYFLAGPLVNLLTYGRYMASVPYAKILVFRNAATALAFVASGIIIGLGFPKIELVNRIIGSGVALVIFTLLIDQYGFFGAAWGQTLSLLVMAMISLIFIFYRKRQLLKHE